MARTLDARRGEGVAAARTGGGERPLCPLILWECLPRDPAAIIQVFPITGKVVLRRDGDHVRHNPAVPVYAALLRGINVGRNKRVGMADLRSLVEGLGHESVRTHLQSGNIVFESPKRSGKALAVAIEKAIEKELGLDVTVIVRRSDELAAVVDRSPYGDRTDDPKKVHVAFLSEPPKAAAVKGFDAGEFAPDELEVAGREVYLLYPEGYARTKLTNAVLEKQLGVRATSRNWRTVKALAELTAG
jgi:uncharacterized protein (DUF1697 family)